MVHDVSSYAQCNHLVRAVAAIPGQRNNSMKPFVEFVDATLLRRLATKIDLPVSVRCSGETKEAVFRDLLKNDETRKAIVVNASQYVKNRGMVCY